MATVRINSVNFSGFTAEINFSSDTGSTLSIGTHGIPYDATLPYYFGTYELYFSAFNKTCIFDIVDHYLLQENNDFLLQEDGSFIIIT